MAFENPRHLVALPTKAGVEAKLETVEAFIADVPIRSANTILKTVDAAIQSSDLIDLHHLRRFIKPDHLPAHLECRDATVPPRHAGADLHSSPDSIEDNTNGSALRYDDSELGRDCVPTKPWHEPSLHFLICATSALPYESLEKLLIQAGPYTDQRLDPNLRVITVPLSPPTSGPQAKQLSQDYWPTAYKGGNPFGPHPAIVARAENEIQGQVKEFMEVGVKVGRSTSTMSMGEAVGAVVVDRTSGSSAVVIAAAGDARWRGISEESRQGCGNAAAHAVMRAIGLVARKRRSFLVGQNSGHQNADTPELFVDEPITSLETDLYEQSTLAAGGYLCHDLELYVTHEPCVMCSMAINHSRFGRVVFGECMLTGGLGTQNRDTNGSDFEYCTYGLWWRPELNWKFLTWSWVGDDDLQTAADVHA